MTSTIDKMLNNKYTKKINDKKLPIIIFGAGIVGEVLFQACSNEGIEVNGFTDNNLNKTKLSKCGIEVIYTPNLKRKYNDAIFLISAADITDVTSQLDNLGYSRFYSGNSLLKKLDISKYTFSSQNNFVEYAVNTCILCHDNYLTPNKLFLRSIDVIITERCSLKCKDCSNLMQYYQKPENCSNEQLIKSVDKFCEIIDEINEFRIIGGEPFINKDIGLLMKRMSDKDKVKKNIIYTNGTIIPNEKNIEFLKNEKTLVLITDYGKLSRNLLGLTEKLKENKIEYYVQKAHGWTNCSKIRKHNRSLEKNVEIFNRCCAKNTITLSEGRLYRCPFSANASRLHAIPDCKEDYVNMFNKEIEINEMKKDIKDFLFKKKFLKTCDFCNGRSFEDPEIEPAIQIVKPLEYKRY